MNLEELRREVQSNGAIQSAAASLDAGKVLEGIDPRQVEQAAKQGDIQALRRFLGQVLSTPEGRSLAERVRRAVQADE